MVGTGAFDRCGLTSVTLPESLVTVNPTAFADNAISGDIVIPGNVTLFYSTVFTGNTGNIQRITVKLSRTLPSDAGAYNDAAEKYKNVPAVTSASPFGAPASTPVFFMDDPQPVLGSGVMQLSVAPNPDGSNTVLITLYTRMNNNTAISGISAGIGSPTLSGVHLSTTPSATDGSQWCEASMTVKNTDGSSGDGNGYYSFVITFGPTGYTTDYVYQIPDPVIFFHHITYVDGAPGVAGTGDFPVDNSTYVQGYRIPLPEQGNMTKSGSVFIGWSETDPTTVGDGTGVIKSQAEQSLLNMMSGTCIFGANDVTLYAVWASMDTALTIRKTVVGNFADMSKGFGFTVYFYLDAEGEEPVAEGTEYSYSGGTDSACATAPDGGTLSLDGEGAAVFSLSDGQSVTIGGIPANCYVRIVETPDPNYIVSFTDSEIPDFIPIINRDIPTDITRVTRPTGVIFTGIISVDTGDDNSFNDTGILAMTADPRTIDFTNTRVEVVPSGIGLGNAGALLLPPALALALAIIAFAGRAALRRPRKRSVR